MANTRSRKANHNNNINDGDNNVRNSPLLPTLEQVMMMQAQMLQTIQETMVQMPQVL
jgi:hypothetical protein